MPQLSRFFCSGFWEILVPWTIYHYPAIRHGVRALGSPHERFVMGDMSIFAVNLDTVQGGFALRQYNKAIQSLIKTTSTDGKRSLEICLIACVQFRDIANPIINGSTDPFRLNTLDESVSILDLHNQPRS